MACGIDFNLNNFKSEILGQASSLLSLSGLIGTPAGVLGQISQVASSLASVKSSLLNMLPISALGDVAALAESGLRNQLGALADLVPNSSAALSKITDIASEFAGITNLSGFANIDLNNITNSVFSVSGTFDPCSISIPNVFTDAAGSLQSLASSVPKIGATDLAKNTSQTQTASSGLFSSFTDNVDVGFGLGDFTSDIGNISSITNSFTDIESGISRALNVGEISNTLANLTKNISPAVTGMSDMIQKLPDGSQILRTKSALIESLKQNQSLYTEV